MPDALTEPGGAISPPRIPSRDALAEAAALELARIASAPCGRGPAPLVVLRELVDEVCPRRSNYAPCHVCGRPEVRIRADDRLSPHRPAGLHPDRPYEECAGTLQPYELPCPTARSSSTRLRVA